MNNILHCQMCKSTKLTFHNLFYEYSGDFLEKLKDKKLVKCRDCGYEELVYKRTIQLFSSCINE